MYTAINGHANTTDWLLNTKHDRDGKNALMHTCLNQNVNVVNIFVKHQYINTYINSRCNKGLTALLYATIEGSLDCVSILM